MTSACAAGRCDDCGADKPSHVLTGGGVFCDRCADARIAAFTGWPTLPEPPPPLVVTGADRRKHTLQYRLWRAPTGISADLIDVRRGPQEGYAFSVLGAHDADTTTLIDHVTAQAHTEINNPSLTSDHGRTVIGDGDDIRGRISYDPDGGPCRVVIDGRDMDWDDLGHLLASYEGWRFQLTLTDRYDDLRPDADIVTLPIRDRGSRR